MNEAIQKSPELPLTSFSPSPSVPTFSYEIAREKLKRS